jgi:microcystin-dependent protein
MASTFTPNLRLEVPARGDYPNQWDLPMDATLNSIDSAYGGTLSLAGQTGGLVVLTQAQANNNVFVVSGSLTSNLIIAFPPIGGGLKWIIPNVTLNGFGLYVRGNNGADQTGVYFLVQYGMPHGILVTPGRVYWNYGSGYPSQLADFPTSFVPPGWIPCDGRAANTTQQDLLFAIIGYSYGGSGASFNLPDYRGFIRPCADNLGTGSAGRFFNLGVNGIVGELSHTLSVAEMPSHNHADTGHGHGVNDPGHIHGGVTVPGGVFSLGQPGYSTQNGNTAAAATGISIAIGAANITYNGGNAAHNNVQPSRTVATCIRW